MCGSGPTVGRTALAYILCHFKREPIVLGVTVVKIDIDDDRSSEDIKIPCFFMCPSRFSSGSHQIS